MDAERIKELREFANATGYWMAGNHLNECLDEIERLQAENEKLIAQYAMLRATTRKVES